MKRILKRTPLALLGLAVFAYLVWISGVTVEQLFAVGRWALPALCLAYAPVVVLDTLGWHRAMRRLAYLPFWPLLGLRIGGDALTNALPGGVFFGEAYKALLMRARFGINLSDNTASLLTVRFGVGVSQAVFVISGLFLAYPTLARGSRAVLGFGGAHHVALVVAMLMGVFLGLVTYLLLRGQFFGRIFWLLSRLPFRQLRTRIARHEGGFALIDAAFLRLAQGNLLGLTLVFAYLLAAWIAGVVETYLLLHFVAGHEQLSTAYVIESVGSLFRLIFFMVPSGIGGQDASFIILFRLFGLSVSSAGLFVLLRRIRELIWIGIGLTIVAVYRPRSVEAVP